MSLTSSQSKCGVGSTSVSAGGDSGTGTDSGGGGAFGSIVKVTTFVLMPSLAVMVWVPGMLGGASKLAEKSPLRSAVVVATTSSSYLTVTCPLNPVPVTVSLVSAVPVVGVRLTPATTVKLPLA